MHEKYRTLLQIVIGATEFGDRQEDILLAVAFAPLDELPAAGDLISAPPPWQARWRVLQVAEGEGLDAWPWVHGDDDEVGLLWYDLELLVDHAELDDTTDGRALVLGRFPAGSSDLRTYVFNF